MLPVPLKVQVIDSGPSAGGVCAVPDGRQSRKSKKLAQSYSTRENNGATDVSRLAV